MSKVYFTTVKNYDINGEKQLGIEVPLEFIEDFQLKDGEVLSWDIDSENGKVIIKKEKIIL